jgi:deoxyadenosine/deoxycytidine kinase
LCLLTIMWIAVEANIGAGKSTLLRSLATTLKGMQITPEPVDEWKGWLPSYYSDKQRWGFPFQMKVLLSFTSIPTENNCITERCACSCRHVFGQHLYDSGCMSTLEWQLFNEYYDFMCRPPDHIIYLRVAPEVCLERITGRARDGEAPIQLQYLSALDSHYESMMKRFPGRVTVVDGSQSPAVVLQVTKGALQQLCVPAVQTPSGHALRSVPPLKPTMPRSPKMLGPPLGGLQPATDSCPQSLADSTPFTPLGYITYKRTYARRMEGHRSEEFRDTIERVLQACQVQLKCGFTQMEIEAARHCFMQLQCSVSGRMLWQLGTTTVDIHGNASLNSCAFIALDSLQSFVLF